MSNMKTILCVYSNHFPVCMHGYQPNIVKQNLCLLNLQVQKIQKWKKCLSCMRSISGILKQCKKFSKVESNLFAWI